MNTNLINIAHFIFSHFLHYFNRQYECLIGDHKVDIRQDGVVQNYFGLDTSIGKKTANKQVFVGG